MSSISEHYREWLRKFPKEPTDRMATALAAVDAYEVFQRSVSAADLRPVVAAACSPHKLVFETGCNILVRLAIDHTDAQQLLLQLAKSKDATARFHAVAYLDEALPEELRRLIVQLALSDRSVKVKRKGIEGAERFGFVEFLPRLDEMQSHDTNKSVQESLAFHIPLLRDGFLLQQSDDGAGYYLTVRGPRSVGGPFISNEKYSEEFVRCEVERLKTCTY